MIDLTSPFHIGVVVANLEEAMGLYSAGTGLIWHSVQSMDVELLVEGRVTPMSVRFNYSVEGPVQLELCEGPIGSFWDAGAYGGIQHIGYWTEDLLGDLDTLADAGWTIRCTGADPDGGPTGFSYLMGPDKQLIELVDVAMRPQFDRWYAGGNFAT